MYQNLFFGFCTTSKIKFKTAQYFHSIIFFIILVFSPKLAAIMIVYVIGPKFEEITENFRIYRKEMIALGGWIVFIKWISRNKYLLNVFWKEYKRVDLIWEWSCVRALVSKAPVFIEILFFVIIHMNPGTSKQVCGGGWWRWLNVI